MANSLKLTRNQLAIMAVIFSNRQLEVTRPLAPVAAGISLWIIHWLISDSFVP
ncbi:hypothetical protein WH390_05960 [Candidatus Arsenophonus nilaparvatae]|uniref:hypothetical protein n=1 Tax=Candidatus Arsenophonus nilaparvatae TaxID=1247023 RepID=UPI0016510353|nr:hypothetical protein [Candidatus Arsenophonus nilaparvatae]